MDPKDFEKAQKETETYNKKEAEPIGRCSISKEKVTIRERYNIY